MGQVLHGSATTTHAIRAAIQRSKATAKELAERHGVNSKTVAKWKKRAFVHDAPMGPKDPRSTVLTVEEEAIAVAFRKHTLLPLDDCLYALQATIPHLTRSSLHRCYQRHGISRLPEIEGDKPAKKAFKPYPIGFFHIDIAEVQTAQGKLFLFVAIDRTSKFAFAKLAEKANRVTASAFLTALIEAVPYKIHTVLTDNGIQFTFPPRYADGPTARYATHMFDMRCRENGIEHRLTKPNHPWTNGQVERMNRTLKEATVRRYHYETHDQLREHLDTFLAAYNFAKRLKTLKGLTPYEYICKRWTENPDQFRLDPIHHKLGLNNLKMWWNETPLFLRLLKGIFSTFGAIFQTRHNLLEYLVSRRGYLGAFDQNPCCGSLHYLSGCFFCRIRVVACRLGSDDLHGIKIVFCFSFCGPLCRRQSPSSISVSYGN